MIPRCTGPSPASQYSPRVTSGQRQRTVALVFSVPFFLRCAGGCASVFAAQGGFGTCYEVKEVSTGDVLAVKIAPKKQLDVSKSKRRHLQDEIKGLKKRQKEYAQLERENRKLLEMKKGVKKTKRALLQQIADLEETIQRERRERAAMEVALSEAYSQTLRELVEAHDAASATAAAPRHGAGAQHKSAARSAAAAAARAADAWFR